MPLSILVVLTLVSTLSFAAQPDRIAGSLAGGQMVTLTGQVHAKAQAQYDQGPVDNSYRLDNITMLLQPSASQQKALKQLLTQQQDPTSPNYHKWLTANQFGQRFGVSQNDVQKITAWLKSQGFKIVSVANGRQFVVFAGTAGQVAETFQTQIHRYNVNGEMHVANARAPMIPAALDGMVGGFRGLHDFNPKPMNFKRMTSGPRASYTKTISGVGTFHFLAPGDVGTIYNINPLYTAGITGSGQSIVVVGQTDINVTDVNDFRTGFGLSSVSSCTAPPSCNTTNLEYIQATTAPGVNAGDQGESDLDLEWSGAIAPSAKIIFVTSNFNSGGVGFSAQYAIDSSPLLANIITMSYGLCELQSTPPSLASQESLFQQAATEGVSFFASSGDDGPAACDATDSSDPTEGTNGVSVNYPASSEYVTGVGGSEFNENGGTYWSATNAANGGSADGYIPEIVWNDTTTSLSNGGGLDATGGGPSNCAVQDSTFTICISGFPKPTWQTGVGVPTDAVRDVPDLAFSASNANDAYVVCTPLSELGLSGSTDSCSPGGATGISNALDIQSGGFIYFSAFGGTSVSTPVMAGITALLNQDFRASGLGLINPMLYKLAASNYSDAFHDVTSGNNIVPCEAGSPDCTGSGQYGFSAGTGYDPVTGWGSLNVSNFAADWAATLPGFTLSANPGTLTVVAGHPSGNSTIILTPDNGFSGTVTYACTGLPTGATCTFTAVDSTHTTLSIQTAASTAATTSAATVTITGTSGTASATTTVSLNVTATDQSYTLTSSVSTLTVTQGSSGSVTITVNPSNGFNSALTFTCADPTSESTCTGPTSATTLTPVSFQITTTAPTAQLRAPAGRGSRIFYAALLPGLLGIFFVGGRKRSVRGMRMLGLLMVLGFSTMWLSSCSNNTSSSTKNAGTPVGMTTITVTSTTGGANPITGTVSFTLNVTAN